MRNKYASGHAYVRADSGCDIKVGLEGWSSLLNSGNQIDAIIGPSCSTACELTGYMGTIANLAQISPTCATF